MADRNIVTSSVIQQKAANFKNESANFEDMIKRMYNDVEEMQNDWQNDTATSFKSELDSLKGSFQKIQQFIFEVSTWLTKYEQDVRAFDEAHKIR